MPVRALTRELYEKMINYYRTRPGDVRGCAEFSGVHEKTARRAWRGPGWTLYAGDWRPALEVFAAEEAAKREEARVAEERERLSYAKEAERARRVEEESVQFEEQSLKVARVNVVVASAALSKLARGITELAARTSKLLEAGRDSDGRPLNLDVAESLRVIQRFATATRGMTEAIETLIQVGKLVRGQPMSITGHLIADLTPEQVAEEVRRATLALGRAKAMGLRLREPGDEPESVEGTGVSVGYAEQEGTEAFCSGGDAYDGIAEKSPAIPLPGAPGEPE